MSRPAQQADYARTALRLPRELHSQVHEAAKKDERTFNAQLIVLLRAGIEARREEQGAAK